MARSNSGSALVAAAQLTTDARQIKHVSADNGAGGVAGFVQLFNSVTQPVNGAVPDAERALAATPASAVFNFEMQGERFGKGLWACLSTTAGQLTLGAATAWFECEYY